MNDKKPQVEELTLISAIDGEELDLGPGDEPTEGYLHLEAQMKDPAGGSGGRKVDDDEDEDEDDFSDEFDEEYAADLEDAAEAELEELLRETGDAPLQQRAGGLVIKLAEYPDGNFPISAHSLYRQNTWTIYVDRYGAVKRVSFEDMTIPMRELKKAFTYHFSPTSRPSVIFVAIKPPTRRQRSSRCWRSMSSSRISWMEARNRSLSSTTAC